MGPLLVDSQWQRTMEVARDEVQGHHVLMAGVIAAAALSGMCLPLILLTV